MKLVKHEKIRSAGEQNYMLCFFLKGSYKPNRTSEGDNQHMDTGAMLIQFTLISERHFTMYLRGIIPS